MNKRQFKKLNKDYYSRLLLKHHVENLNLYKRSVIMEKKQRLNGLYPKRLFVVGLDKWLVELTKSWIDKDRMLTPYFDDNRQQIRVGDILQSIDGYQVKVYKLIESGEYVGKLICESTHSCANIPYCLNKGMGFKILKQINNCG